MKIEKISDNQIRCTLNRSDLAERQLKISELAYGSEKAKDLFREMMQQASYEFGFEAEDIPLMIEAIPMSPDCIVLIITKVEDPDELDTRFSRFSPGTSGDDEDDDDSDDFDDEYGDSSGPDESFSSAISSEVPGGADEIINLFNKVKDYLNKNLSELGKDKPEFIPFNKSLKDSSKSTAGIKDTSSKGDDAMEQALLENLDKMETIDGTPRETGDSDNFEINMVKLFTFNNLKTLGHVAGIIGNMYDGINSLFYNPVEKRYYLQIAKSDCDPLVYNKVCNILSEYGTRETTSYARLAFFEENFKTIIKNCAIQTLANI